MAKLVSLVAFVLWSILIGDCSNLMKQNVTEYVSVFKKHVSTGTNQETCLCFQVL
jgi:hypothetical protein